MKRVILLAALLLSACGAAELNDPSIKPIEELPIRLQDQRPTEEKLTDKGSMLVTACAYGIYSYGDDRLTPRPAVYLANYLNKHFTSQGADDTFVLHHLRVVYNAQAILRRGTYGANRGLVADVMSGNSCYPGVETPGGIDYNTENLDGGSAVLIYLDGEFRGHQYTARHIESVPPKASQFDYMFPALSHAFDEAFAGSGGGR